MSCCRPRGWMVAAVLALLVFAPTGSIVPGIAPAAAQSAGMDDVVALANDGCDWLLIRAGGTVWGRGYNSDWNLGVTLPGDEIVTQISVQVTGLDEVREVACGWGHGLAVRADGTVWAWGRNDFGQVGVPTEDCPFHARPCSKVPVAVPGLDEVTSVAATDYSSFALRADGTVWGWGESPPLAMGEVDDSSAVVNLSPIQVEGLTAITGISGIANEMLALRDDGTVWSWGGGEATPSQVSDLDDVVEVAAGDVRHLARKADGSVWAWGEGDDPAPALVADLGPATALAGGGSQSAAVVADGTVWIWGSASIGAPAKPPAQAAGLEDVVAIAMNSGNQIVALRDDGTAWTRNVYQQVQQVAALDVATPTP